MLAGWWRLLLLCLPCDWSRNWWCIEAGAGESEIGIENGAFFSFFFFVFSFFFCCCCCCLRSGCESKKKKPKRNRDDSNNRVREMPRTLDWRLRGDGGWWPWPIGWQPIRQQRRCHLKRGPPPAGQSVSAIEIDWLFVHFNWLIWIQWADSFSSLCVYTPDSISRRVLLVFAVFCCCCCCFFSPPLGL